MLSAYVSYLLGYSYASRQVSGKIPQIATCTVRKYVNNTVPLLNSEELGLWMKTMFYKALHLTRGRILPFESENRQR